ncbi:hypothetical protein GQX73_g7980 [Xylaria multiplex]|uniref:Uncharacterized protein n=1 Tax=Xylaria multiplex TaxID=323545 RepID=A0A7C8MPK5_9PEZI|nr:hypothetical protein GQX73_g7980 [Xylaria multiplex]
MPRHNSRHHSRSSRTNARGLPRARRRMNEHDNEFSATGNETHTGSDSLHYLQQGLSALSWNRDAMVVPHPDNSISLDPAMPVPGYRAPETNDDSTFSSNPYYSYSPSRWEDSLIAYRGNSHDYPQEPVLPTTSPIDRNSTSLVGDVYSQTGSTLSGYHGDQGWTVPEVSDETSEEGSPTGQMPRTSRRLSMRARHGSGVELDTSLYDNEVTTSTNREDVRSDSSGGTTTPVDRDQYLDACMSGDVPWSPEFLHQAPRYHYQF